MEAQHLRGLQQTRHISYTVYLELLAPKEASLVISSIDDKYDRNFSEEMEACG